MVVAVVDVVMMKGVISKHMLVFTAGREGRTVDIVDYADPCACRGKAAGLMQRRRDDKGILPTTEVALGKVGR
jgi:hypothetical protein